MLHRAAPSAQQLCVDKTRLGQVRRSFLKAAVLFSAFRLQKLIPRNSSAMQAVSLFQATKPGLQISAVSGGGVQWEGKLKRPARAVIKVIFFDWKKGLCFYWIHSLFSIKKDSECQEKEEEFPKRSTRMMRIVLQGKPVFGRAGTPLYGERQNSEQTFTPQETPEKEFKREKSFKQFQALLLLIAARNTPQPHTTLLQQNWLTPQ